MKIYKVGGCIRDKLLNLPVNDYDYVVVGSSVEEMINLGFKPVGKNFPVFLHPITNDEYALARSEKKISAGYKGFEFYTTKNITINDDLKRRDITINAIAEDEFGNIIDPYNGLTDLTNKIIRHVSEAFVEDPLRVFRVARFKAKLSFTIDAETIELMKKIVISGEIEQLSQERVWIELQKSLKYINVIYFFEVLDSVNVFKRVMVELCDVFRNLPTENLFTILTKKFYNYSYEFNYCILIFYLGYVKNFTLALTFINRSYINNQSKELAMLLIDTFEVISDFKTIDQIYILIKKIDVTRKKKRYNSLILLMNNILLQLNDKKIEYLYDKIKKNMY